MENQVTVVVAADGRIIHKEQNGVFRRSNGQNKLVALLDFSSEYVVKVNFLRPDGVKPKSQYMAYTDKRDYDGKSYSAYEYVMKEFQLDATGQLVVSLNMQNGSTVATSGDFIIDVEASESSYDDVAPTDPNQFDETVQSLMQTDAKLLDRTANVPNLVASIQKVAPNAIMYTDNSGVKSAPIVIEGGETAPIPVNAASTIQIPKGAWQPAEDGQTVTGYKYIVTAGLHGQMRDGATANDLWVSFDEADSAAFRGAYEDYTVDTAGNITISVTQPIAMTVRVWNGKGLVDEVARADIAAETARAQSAESDLQAQIDHIEDSGYDRTAREMIAAETERAEAAETQLQQNIDAEKMRAEAAAEQLQERLQEQIDDLETTKVDVSGGTMNDKLVVKGNNFPHVQVLNTVEGLSGYFEQSGGSLDIIARDAEGENLSCISLEDGIVRSHAALYENDQRVYSPNNPPPTGEVSSVNGQTGAVTITPENIGAVKIGGFYTGDLNALTENGTYKIDDANGTPANMPPAEPNGQLIVSHNGDTTAQIYITYHTKEMWIRGGRDNGTDWADWFQVANKDAVLPLSGGTMTDSLTIEKSAYPSVTLIQTTTGNKALFENGGRALDLILRDSNNNNKSLVSVAEYGLVSNNVNDFLSYSNEFNFWGPACAYNVVFIGYRGAANETDHPQIYAFNGGRAQTDDQADILARRVYVGTWGNRQEVYSPNNPPIGYIDLLNLRGTQGQHDVTLDNIGIGDTRIGIVLSGVYEYNNTYRVKFPSGGTYDGVYFSEQDKDYSVMRRAAGGSSFFLTGATPGGANGNYIGFFIYTRTA